MRILRRVLRLQAVIWGLAGLGVAVAPRFFLVRLFGQPPLPEDTWARLSGIEAMGLAMVMVLVANRVEDLWWWSWAFALVDVGTAAVVTLHAALGLVPGQSTVLWWVFSGTALAMAFLFMVALFVSSREQPLP